MKNVALFGSLLLIVAILGAAYYFGLFAPSSDALKGRPIDETAMIDLSGQKRSFAELRGQPATLYFWATWCKPCLETLSARAKETPVPEENFITVALEDDPERVAATLARIGYRGPSWVATDGMSLIQRRYAGNDKRAVPFIVELDEEGRILASSYGE